MATTLLSGDPILVQVEVSTNLETPTPIAWVRCVFKSMDGHTAVYSETITGTDTDPLPTDFFKTTVKADLSAALLAVNYRFSDDYSPNPLPTDLTVWDPATNAPYP